MPLLEQITKDLTQAMKAKDQLRLDTLRMVKSALKNREIDAGKPLDDAEIIKSLNTLVKQRREAADQYAKGNRQELADKELAEIKVIEAYLPAAVGEAEIEQAVVEAISALAAPSAKDTGSVMKAVMAKFAGKTIDGKLVNSIVRQKLGG
jgi:uncharacterized protein